jgi:hypothetical protein
MLDAAAYPHILDAILGASDHSALLALRGASRSMADRADALLFRHVALVFTPAIVTVRRPDLTQRLPLARQVLVSRAADWNEALMRRWQRALSFTLVADLHGSGPKDTSLVWGGRELHAQLGRIAVPLVRDTLVRELLERRPCPLAGREWHAYCWLDGIYSPEPSQAAHTAVLHFARQGGIAKFNLPLWFQDPAWRLENHNLHEIVLVLQDRPCQPAPWYENMRKLSASLYHVLLRTGARITFVGWERVEAVEEVEEMEDPSDDGPHRSRLAGRYADRCVYRHRVSGGHPGRMELRRRPVGGEDRLAHCRRVAPNRDRSRAGAWRPAQPAHSIKPFNRYYYVSEAGGSSQKEAVKGDAALQMHQVLATSIGTGSQCEQPFRAFITTFRHNSGG